MTFEPSEGLIISLFGGISAMLVSLCACVLKSRCTRIKFGCIELDRDVLGASDFATVDHHLVVPPLKKSVPTTTTRPDQEDAPTQQSIDVGGD